MAESGEGRLDGEIDWDDVVDVICVGSGPGLSGYASACAAKDLDVLLADLPAGDPDAHTAAFLAAMTEDLDVLPPDTETPVARLVATETVGVRGVTVDTFVGEQLRLWSSHCLASSSGVLFTHVPDHVLMPMRNEVGEPVMAAVLPDVDPGSGPASDGETLAGLVFEWGRMAGAALEGPSGRRLVRADLGLAFAVGTAGTAVPGSPLALVGRRGGRFARLERLTVGD